MDKWNSKIQFPTDNFKVRITEESFGPSSNSKPMITLGFEIVSPEVVNIGGVDYTVAGQEVKPYYMVTKSVEPDGSEDVEKSAYNQKRLNEVTDKLSMPRTTDFENPALGFKGKLIWVLLTSEVQEKRKAPTAEQLAKGVREGDVIKNPITGEPLVTYWPRVQEIFGLAPE